MSRGLTRLVVVWPWVLALLVCAPLLAPGYVLTYDMVWVPDLALRPDTVGLGSALPRAVPSDAVVAVLDEVVPGQVLQKVMLVGVLGVAGAGMARLWEPTMPVGALASSTLYVWNPFVAERLVLGHWPLLVAYAALPWLLSGARQLRREDSGGWTRVGAALLVMSMTPATGLMGMLAALCCGVDVRRGGRGRRVASLVAVGVAANATWICAGLANLAASRSDSNAGGLFGARAEGYWGPSLAGDPRRGVERRCRPGEPHDDPGRGRRTAARARDGSRSGRARSTARGARVSTSSHSRSGGRVVGVAGAGCGGTGR
jgi:hypothetical protein